MHFVVKMKIIKEDNYQVMAYTATAQEARRVANLLQACHKPMDVYYEAYTQA